MKVGVEKPKHRTTYPIVSFADLRTGDIFTSPNSDLLCIVAKRTEDSIDSVSERQRYTLKSRKYSFVKIFENTEAQLPEFYEDNKHECLHQIAIQYLNGNLGKTMNEDPNNISCENIEKFKPNTEELSFPEGELKYKLHVSRERNKVLVALKKKQAFDKNPLLPCEICGISLKEKYGNVGEGFIEAHHIVPISDLTEVAKTSLVDLILLCPNCHTMIHRKRPWLIIEQIKDLLAH